VLLIQRIDKSLERMVYARCAFVCLVEARIRPMPEEVKRNKMEKNQVNNGYVKASKNDRRSTKFDRPSAIFSSLFTVL
jgi:hypothetical protein